jgi:hypothetical protein
MQKKYAFVLLANILAAYSCYKCEDTSCFSPPGTFIFQILGKDSGEDLVANGTYPAQAIEIYSLGQQKKHQLALSSTGQAVFFVTT